MTRKLGIVSITLFVSILIAGLYGMLHDQITYSISNEYFTKFKYRQFGFDPAWFGGDRQTVAIIGFLATWWFGLLIGLLIGLTAWIFPEIRAMKKAIKKGILLVFLTVVLAGIAGYFYGRFYLAGTGVRWWLPADLEDRSHFIITGSIHNFSYAGGLLGLFIALAWMIRARIYGSRSLDAPGDSSQRKASPFTR